MNSMIKGHLLAFITVLFWGTTFISTKVLLNSFSPVEILVFRFILGFAALWAAYPHKMAFKREREIYFAAAGLSGVTLYYLLENIALVYSTACNVGVIVSVAPFFTAQLSYMVDGGEKPSNGFYIGFIFAMAGIAMISFDGAASMQINPVGDLLALLAAAVWAVYSVIIKRVNAFDCSGIAATRRIFFYGLMFMVPLSFPLGFKWQLSRFASPLNSLNILFLGIIACAACFASWNYAIKLLGAVKTSVYIYLVPVVTVISSVIILKERLTPVSALGTVLTLLGLLLSQKHEKLKQQ